MSLDSTEDECEDCGEIYDSYDLCNDCGVALVVVIVNCECGL